MRRKLAVLAASTLGLCATGAFASTGAFTSPLTNAFLSVDINGGPLSSATTPTNGWNENTTSGGFTADNFGVLWSPWGGNTYTGGDGVQLPSSQSTPNVNAATISKTFSFNGPPVTSYGYGPQDPITPTTVSISLDTTNNTAAYATVNGSASMNSRDRGSPSGANGLNDNDMFQDLLFAGGSGSNVQGTNMLQVQFGGLIPGAPYEIALYSYDYSSGNSMNWTATAPTTSGGLDGWWAASPSGNNTFTAPADMQTITWTTNGPTPAPAIYTLTANSLGDVTVYGFGGSGSGQSATSSYIDGFQVALVPEPASLSLLAVGAVGLMARRRTSKA